MLTNWMSVKLAFSFDGPPHIPLHAQVVYIKLIAKTFQREMVSNNTMTKDAFEDIVCIL
jgi:hypothetical protein